jgi:hypothetical protein
VTARPRSAPPMNNGALTVASYRFGQPSGADGRVFWRSFLVAPAARNAPLVATMGPVVRMELERVEALELLGMTLAHLNDAEVRAEMSPRVALLMAIRDKLALGLREER